MSPVPLRRVLALAASAAALAGCAGAPTRIHTLEAQGAAAGADGPAAAWSGPAFRIDTVHVPAAFDRPELVRRTDRFTVELSDTDRWAAPLGELVRRALTQDLERRLPPGAVIYPYAPKPPAASGLVVDILTVHPDAGGVSMDASWTWVTPRAPVARAAPNGAVTVTTPPPAPTPSRPVHLTTAAAGQGAAAIAPELSDLLSQLADRIAADRPPR